MMASHRLGDTLSCMCYFYMLILQSQSLLQDVPEQQHGSCWHGIAMWYCTHSFSLKGRLQCQSLQLCKVLGHVFTMCIYVAEHFCIGIEK